jgi:hypothetical protein
MSSLFERSFGYGLGTAVGKALFGDPEEDLRKQPRQPIRRQTEEEFRADEERYDEEAKRLEAEGKAERAEE